MISKEILIQYSDLQQEIIELQERRKTLEKQFKSFLDGGTVTDMVTGGSGGIQHFKIEGFPIVAYEKARKSLQKNIQRIEDKYTELLELSPPKCGYVPAFPSREHAVRGARRSRISNACTPLRPSRCK